MEPRDEKAAHNELRRLELVSDLGLAFVEAIQRLDAEQLICLQGRLQLVNQAASPAMVRNISTHATRLDYTGLPAKIGNFKGIPHLLGAWFKRRALRRNIRTFGMPIVDVHVVTYARNADPTSDLIILKRSGYRMASLFELLCFVDGSPRLLGQNDQFITLKEHRNGKGAKQRIVTIAHCINQSQKAGLVHKTHEFSNLLEKRVRMQRPPLLHFVLMDANQQTVTGSGDDKPPSDA